MDIKKVLVRFHWLFSVQFGIDLRLFLRSMRGLPRYVGDLMRFRKGYSGRIQLLPCLHDWYEEGGSTTNEYFWQDLIVARMIATTKPAKHVDIGSRVDGFVAHVASFRDIEVFDVRPITTQMPGVIFRQADFMKEMVGMTEYCDSLSCLHALEHFGLGRYGDPIDPEGSERGFANMASLLRKNGLFYLSVPIGIDRVEFNANRIFDPRTIIKMAEKNSLQISALTVIQQGGETRKVTPTELVLAELASQNYSLGLFTFMKSGAN